MNSGVKEIIKNWRIAWWGYSIYLGARPFLQFRLLAWIRHWIRFQQDWRHYKKMSPEPGFQLDSKDWIPCLNDRTSHTPLDPVYFHQDVWAAGIIFRLQPKTHIDIGSAATTVGIISQFVPTTMIDIRPLPLQVPGLTFQEGSILALPFSDNSVASVSSLCVVEHIGLGRYGDPIQPGGSEAAIKELQRVLTPGGNLLFSVPIDAYNRIYFNAHRAFTREYILSQFDQCEVCEEKYIYGKNRVDNYNPQMGFGTGLFWLRKKQINP